MGEKDGMRKSRALMLCNAGRVSANPRIGSYFLETMGRTIERPCLEIEMAFAVYTFSVDGETA